MKNKAIMIIGFLGAIALHVGILLFGGIILPSNHAGKKAEEQVELVSDMTEEKQEEEKKEPEEKPEEVAEQKDAPPDASEVVRNLEPAAAEPALAAMSLSDIESALNGAGGDDGGFGGMTSFASGGRIGGKGAPGSKSQGDAMDEAFASADLDQKPRAIFQAPPAYPVELRGKKVEGVVHVFFIIDAQGRVVDPRVEKSPHPAFTKPALDAIKKWRFEPAMRGGQKVASKMKVPIRFQGA